MHIESTGTGSTGLVLTQTDAQVRVGFFPATIVGVDIGPDSRGHGVYPILTFLLPEAMLIDRILLLRASDHAWFAQLLDALGKPKNGSLSDLLGGECEASLVFQYSDVGLSISIGEVRSASGQCVASS